MLQIGGGAGYFIQPVMKPEKQTKYAARSQYKIPHRTTFSRTVIPKLYRNTVDSLKAEISSDIAAALESIMFTTNM